MFVHTGISLYAHYYMLSRPYHPYARFKGHSLSLNDYLAIDRTILANERTLLAYGRTALAEVIIGGSALKFFDSVVLTIMGWGFLFGALLTLVIGWRRYHHTNQLLHAALLRRTGDEQHPLEQDLEGTASKEATPRESSATPPERQ